MQRTGITEIEKLRIYLDLKIKKVTGDDTLAVVAAPEGSNHTFEVHLSHEQLDTMEKIEAFDLEFRHHTLEKIFPPLPSSKRNLYLPQVTEIFKNGNEKYIAELETVYTVSQAERTPSDIYLAVPPQIALQQAAENDPEIFGLAMDKIYGDRRARTPEEYTRDFREVFTHKVNNEPRIPASQKSDVIDRVCAFVADDCREPSLLPGGNIGTTDKLAKGNEMFISLNENIRRMQLGDALEKKVIQLAHSSNNVVRRGMAEFRAERSQEAGRG